MESRHPQNDGLGAKLPGKAFQDWIGATHEVAKVRPETGDRRITLE